MKTKLVKSITSYLLLACALVCLVAVIALGTSAPARAAADAQVCSVGMLKGLYLWTFDGYANLGGNLVPKAIMEGKRFNGDGTMDRYLRHGEHRGHDYYRRHRSGRNLYGRTGLHGHHVIPTAQALTYTSDRVHRSFGSPRLPG